MSVRAEQRLARSPGISYQELLDTDSRAVPDVLRLTSPQHLGSADVPIDRYTSRTWHDLEVERLWGRVWQFACREEEIPRAGDFHVYEIASMSFVVIRTRSGAIKAYRNACLHRGRRLKDYDGHCSELRCPFHGFAWALDGALQDVPARWDFPHVGDEEFRLPEASVDTWAGFVFINPDPVAEPLAAFVSDLAEQFSDWDLARYYKEAHVARIINANWKIAQEAFCEAFHVNATHPQIMPYIGDTNSQVDIWENCARVITPGGTPSPLLGWQPTQEEMLRAMLDARIGEALPVTAGRGSNDAGARRGDDPRALATGVGRSRRAAVRRRADGQHRLHAVPELPPVGRAQPHRLPVPSQRRRSPQLDHGRAVPLALCR